MSVVIPPRGTRGAKFPMPGGRLASFFTSVMGFLMRRGVRVQGRPLLELITVGAKSGKTRRTILGWFDDPSDPQARLIVASAAGSATHPSWFINLAKHPESVQIDDGRGTIAVSVETLAGAERASAWERVVAVAPGYGPYATTTDREIPIVRLTPRP
jgi:deazaflavin-dependent oxidoreductase (nitroreductase family)